jgi:hypothetical protein
MARRVEPAGFLGNCRHELPVPDLLSRILRPGAHSGFKRGIPAQIGVAEKALAMKQPELSSLGSACLSFRDLETERTEAKEALEG